MIFIIGVDAEILHMFPNVVHNNYISNSKACFVILTMLSTYTKYINEILLRCICPQIIKISQVYILAERSFTLRPLCNIRLKLNTNRESTMSF